MEVCTYGYFPFTMGGEVWRPIKCDVPITGGPFDLGSGYEGYLITSPNGTTFVAESITGMFVGSTIEEVRNDISCADYKVMKIQIEDAKKDFAKSTAIPVEEFWRMLRSSE